MNNEPTFKTVFGDAWEELPPVMHKHYANRPYSKDVYYVKGRLDVRACKAIRLLAPLLRILGAMPPHTEKNVTVTVRFESNPENNAFRLNRHFQFKHHKPYQFQSDMIPITAQDMIEMVTLNVGWRMRYTWEDNRVKLKHQGYAFKFFNHYIPLPLTYVLGKVDAEEEAIDDNTFNMFVSVTHPWFGDIYGYQGQFSMQDSL